MNMKLDRKFKLVAVAKDEAAYLSQWIHHHLYFGFDEIQIYINRTTDNSVDVINKISQEYPQVSFKCSDWVDKLPEPSRKNIQHISYMQAIDDIDEDDYVMFLDIDEYWICSDFHTKIFNYMEPYDSCDVMVFEWFNEGSCRDILSIIPPVITGKLHQLGKSIVKGKNKINKIRLHVPEMHESSQVILANGDKFFPEDRVKLPQHVKKNINSLKDAFIVHRLHRSESEYLSSLFRGNPEMDFPIKLNRLGFGYERSDKNVMSIDIRGEAYNNYKESYKSFESRCGIDEYTELFNNNIHEGVNNLKSVLPFVIKSKPDAVKKVLRYISDPEILHLVEPKKSSKVNKFVPKVRKKIIIHAGAHKTGTTTIQNTLYRYKDKLNSIGVEYAELGDGRANHSVAIYDSFIQNLDSKSNVRNLTKKDVVKNRNKLEKYFINLSRRDDWNTLIISGESISTMNVDMLKNLKEFLSSIFLEQCDIECVYVVRNPYNYYRSALQERIKRDSLDAILNSGYPEGNIFRGNIAKLKSVFGQNAVIVRSFENLCSLNGSLSNSFLDSILTDGFSKFKIELVDSLDNASMSSEAFDFLDFIHKENRVSVRQDEFLSDVSRLSTISNLTRFELSEDIVELIDVSSRLDIDYLKNNHNISYHKEEVKDSVHPWAVECIEIFGQNIHLLPKYLKNEAIKFFNMKIASGKYDEEQNKSFARVISLSSEKRNYLSSPNFISKSNRIKALLRKVLK